MEKLIEDIQQHSLVEIKGESYRVLAKARYSMGKGGGYVKVFLEGEYALVDFLEGKGTLMFLKNYWAILPDFPTPETFSFEGEEYQRVNTDTQLLQEVFFGEEGDFEGDLEFMDYEGKNAEKKFISIGYVSENGERADLVGELVNIEEIVVK